MRRKIIGARYGSFYILVYSSYPLISVFCIVDFLIRQLKLNLKGEWL